MSSLAERRRERLETWRMEARLEDARIEIVAECSDPQGVWARRYRHDVRQLLDEIGHLESTPNPPGYRDLDPACNWSDHAPGGWCQRCAKVSVTP